MNNSTFKSKAEEILKLADIKINGDRPWDIQILNENFYERVFGEGSLGLGESYMDHWWDSQKLDEFFARIFQADLGKQVPPSANLIFHVLKAKLTNQQKKSKAFNIGEKHYDVGNDLYKAMLDKRMTYTCGYWKNASNLDEAQEAKLDLVCKKIGVQKGQKVLDIGCGWGSFAKFAAEKYGAEVVGITVSKEQQSLGQEMCKGLPVEIRLQDYRDINEKFDHIISLGMFEHVGPKNYRAYMEVADRCLKREGIFLLHTIGSNTSHDSTDPWINKYIFPNGVIPSMKQISESIEGIFIMEDWHNFGPYYDRTLMAWFENFNKNWPTLKEKFDERFYRKWKYYLLCCAATFRERVNQLWQITLTKRGSHRFYESIR